MITLISNGHFINLNGDGLAPCLNGHALSYMPVTGQSGRVYIVPYCSVDNPIPDITTVAQIYGVSENTL